MSGYVPDCAAVHTPVGRRDLELRVYKSEDGELVAVEDTHFAALITASLPGWRAFVAAVKAGEFDIPEKEDPS